MEWEYLLPKNLQDAAYKAGSECAWNKKDALQIIEILYNRGYVVLGVDVWLPTQPGPIIPTPFVYDWSLSADAPDPAHPKSAQEFIHAFEWDRTDMSHHGMEPYFNILAKACDS
jgi:hypothetical protein